MGRYFGIRNNTRNEGVSGSWKGYEWCDLYEVMHMRGWTHEDSIISGCYDTRCEFIFCTSTNADGIDINEAECINMQDEMYDYYKSSESECSTPRDDVIKTYTANYEEDYGCYLNATINKKHETVYEFNMSTSDRKITKDHCPIWENGKCKICGYEVKLDKCIVASSTSFYFG